MRKLTILACLFILGVSCSNFLEEYSQDMTRVNGLVDLDELLIGDAYMQPGARIDNYRMDQPFFLGLHLMSDELAMYEQCNDGDGGLFTMKKMFGWYTWQQSVGLNQEGTSFYKEDDDWNELYKRIKVANMVLESVDEQPVANEDDARMRDRIAGEAHFLRGWYYFTLVNMYARPYKPSTAATEPGVPLKLTGYIEDVEYRRTPVKEVYDQVLEDLHEAHRCLARAEVKNHPYRADVTAADLLLSRVYLYMQDWQHAYDWADSVLVRKSDLKDLRSQSAGNFLNRNLSEVIFSMGGHLLSSSIEGYDLYGDGLIPICTISQELLDAYDDNDMRKGTFITSLITDCWSHGGGEYWVFNKVSGVEEGEFCDVGDYSLFRTAEAYLNQAEAAAYLNNEGKAKSLLQHLRSFRVEGDDVTEYGSGETLVHFIRAERQRELCLEGHRWFDLRRYTVAEKYPYSKEIKHVYVTFREGYPNGGSPLQSWTYTLKENDEAYTLAIPREVLAQQNSMGSHIRPYREGEIIVPDYAKMGAEAGASDGNEAAMMKDYMDYYEDVEEALMSYLSDLDYSLMLIEEYMTNYEAAFRQAWEEYFSY